MRTAAAELQTRSPLLERRDLVLDRGVYGVILPRAGILLVLLVTATGATQIQQIALDRWHADGERIAAALETLLDSIDPIAQGSTIRLVSDDPKPRRFGDLTIRTLRSLGFGPATS